MYMKQEAVYDNICVPSDHVCLFSLSQTALVSMYQHRWKMYTRNCAM
jgi:hypothetical protein